MRTVWIFALLAATWAGASSASAQDAAAGEKIFLKCRTCHQIGPTAKNGIAPVLNGIDGRKTGSVEGYSYSAANKNSGIVWNKEEFLKYIAAPQKVIPGTKMSFPGLPDPKDAENVWAYISQFDASGNKKQ